MLKYIILFILILVNSSFASAQKSVVLSGSVKDKHTGEDLTGATILAIGAEHSGTITNNYGFFSLMLPEGNYVVVIQHIGFEPDSVNLILAKSEKIEVLLSPKTYELDNVLVTGTRADKNIRSLQMGNTEMTPLQVKTIPVIFGEPDILKTIQLTPGVKSAGEGNSGFHVRGGGIDQNLILLDEAPVYNATHLLGFFSVFNSEALKNASLYKGSIPAKYGGRASSVLDIQMKEGNMKNFSAGGNIGLISSNFVAEGPLLKDKSSFMLSGRRTYADLFLKLSNNEDIRKTHLYFYDLNLKANYKIDDKNRIYLSGYMGRDDLGYKNEFGFDWGSATGTLRWNHIFSDRLFSNTSIIISNYSYNISLFQSLDIVIQSKIRDVNIKQDFSYYKNSNNTLKFGLNVISHNTLPGQVNVNPETELIIPDTVSRRKAIEWTGYLENSWRTGSNFSMNYGFRAAFFSNIGKGEFFEFDKNGEITHTHRPGNFEFFKTQGGIEPRIALNYTFNRQNAIKASYNRMFQFLHLLSNSTTSTPVDIWLPSSNNVKPQIADQLSMGFFRNFRDNAFESSVEVYYKDLKNQIEYKNGADLFFNSTVETELVFGRGWAYGAEFSLIKSAGRLHGWLNYTWSKTMRKFEEINNGNPFSARHDCTHDVAIVGMYDITNKLKFSATWVFYTGNAVTFPSGKYEIDDKVIGYYTERNGYRMPDYHRLDIGLTWLVKKTAKYESGWNFSLYNAYARENAYFIDFKPKDNNPQETEAVQVSLFKAIPSVSYKFKF